MAENGCRHCRYRCATCILRDLDEARSRIREDRGILIQRFPELDVKVQANKIGPIERALTRALSFVFVMRYHFKKPAIFSSLYGRTHICDHPVYNRCTVYEIDGKGLAVIQQRFNSINKSTRWTEIDSWLTDALYLHPKFKEFFDKRAGEKIGDIYPTVTLRQIMWALKMKPLKKERWETVFDRCDI